MLSEPYLQELPVRLVTSCFKLSERATADQLMDHITVNDLHSVPKSACKKHHSTESASRLVCRAPRYCHISPLMRGLHYLPIRQGIHFKILLLTFTPIRGIALLSIEDLDLLKSQGA